MVSHVPVDTFCSVYLINLLRDTVILKRELFSGLQLCNNATAQTMYAWEVNILSISAYVFAMVKIFISTC